MVGTSEKRHSHSFSGVGIKAYLRRSRIIFVGLTSVYVVNSV